MLDLAIVQRMSAALTWSLSKCRLQLARRAAAVSGLTDLAFSASGQSVQLTADRTDFFALDRPTTVARAAALIVSSAVLQSRR
jgi:hypothetical protein